MPYDDEELPYDEPDPALNEITRAVIGAAIEVHMQLGPGLDEALYEAALAIEFRLRRITFVRQPIYGVEFKGEPIGEKRLDFIVAGSIVVELKAIDSLGPIHKAQVLTYLHISGKKLGLLINFNVRTLKEGIRRIINPSAL